MIRRDWILIDRARPPQSRREADARVEDACQRLDVSRKTLMGGSRRRKLAWARQEIMLGLYEQDHWTYPRIARYFGMDHTTILHGVKAAAARRDRLPTPPIVSKAA